MRNKTIITLLMACALVSCGTQKQAVSDVSSTPAQHHSDQSAAFIESVIAGAVDVENITGNATIKLQAGTQSIKVSGALRMRRDEVIRLQLFMPVIGTEVGRLEFTPDYVLIMDRINKQYVRASYDDADFLRRNNITFYTLQSLFWNELVSPSGRRAVSGDAEAYSIDWSNSLSYVPITLTMGDNKFQWQANNSDAGLSSLVITTDSGAGVPSMLTWLYSNFTSVGGKKFPKTQQFSFSTTTGGESKRAELTIDMSEIKTSSDWDATTEISSKYKEVSVESVFSKLISY